MSLRLYRFIQLSTDALQLYEVSQGFSSDNEINNKQISCKQRKRNQMALSGFRWVGHIAGERGDCFLNHKDILQTGFKA